MHGMGSLASSISPLNVGTCQRSDGQHICCEVSLMMKISRKFCQADLLLMTKVNDATVSRIIILSQTLLISSDPYITFYLSNIHFERRRFPSYPTFFPFSPFLSFHKNFPPLLQTPFFPQLRFSLERNIPLTASQSRRPVKKKKRTEKKRREGRK